MPVTLEDVRRIGDPLRSYNFDLLITSMPGNGDGNLIRLSVTTASIPGFAVESFESNHHGHTIKHAGRGIHTRTLTIEYEESSDLRIYNAFRSWRDLQWHPVTGVQAEPAEYKTDGFLELYDAGKNQTKRIKMIGMYVEDVADSILDGAASDSVKVSVTFSYDYTDDDA